MSFNTLHLDVLFYAERKLHLPFLEPIHDYFQKQHPDLCLAFSSPKYHPPVQHVPGWGLKQATIRRLQKKSRFIPPEEAVRPRVTVVADVCHYNLPWQGKVVNVGHGLICKGMYYRRDPVVRRENLSDLICVPGPWHKRRLEDNVFVPIRVTGFIRSDLLFGSNAEDRESFCFRHDVDPQKNIVLFAPTFNPELSAIPFVRDRITELGGDSSLVCVKLHQMTPKPWKEMYWRLAEEREDVIFLRDDDYSGMMHAADVMVSDVSSMFVEFMLLNKPVVLFNSPQLKSFENYDPSDLEHKIRDAVLEADTLPILRNKVDKALAHPEILEEQRLRYVEELDYGRDGKSAQRAAGAIMELLLKPRGPRPCPRYSILLESAPDANASVHKEAVAEVVAKSGELPIEILPVKLVDEPVSPDVPTGVRAGRTVQGLARACASAKGEWVVLLQPGWVLPMNWLKWMENHFHWHRRVGMVKAMSDLEQARHVHKLLFVDHPFPADNEELAWGFRTIGIGSAAFNDRIPSPCVMVPRSIAHSLAGQFSKEMSFLGFIQYVDDVLIRAGHLSVTSLETYCFCNGSTPGNIPG